MADSKESKNLLTHFKSFWHAIFKEETKPADDANESNKASKKPEVVKFSDPKPVAPPPLKVEVQDSDQNPAARYLVYALGGFLVMSWIWARWQERKERFGKKDSNDNNESSPAGEDDGYHSA